MAYVQIKQYDPKKGYYYITKWVDDNVKTAQQPTKYTSPIQFGTTPAVTLPKAGQGVTNYTSASGKSYSSPPVGSNPGTPASSSGGSSATSSSPFRNSISSLLPKAYASTGADLVKSASTATSNPFLTALGPLATAYSTVRDFLQTQGKNVLPNIGQGLKSTLPANINAGAKGLQNYISDLGYNSIGNPVNKSQQIVNKLDTFKPTTSGNNSTGTVLGAQDVYNKYGSQYTNALNAKTSTSANPFQNVQDVLTAIDADTNAKLDALYSQYANGEMDQGEYERKIAEEQQAASNKVYDQLIAQQEGEIPLINQEFDTAKAQAEGTLTEQKASAEKLKTSNTNTYGAAMRQIVGNKDISQANLRNMFGSLGTAESSTFMDKAAQLERAAGDNVATTQNELTGKIADIDNTVLSYENQVKNTVNNLLLEKEKQIKTVRDAVNLSQAQKSAKINEINAQMYQNLIALKSQREAQTQAFANLKYQLVASSGDLLKNAVVSDSLYNRAGTPQTYDSGTNNISTSSILKNKNKTANGVRQAEIDPKTGQIRYYYLDASGNKTYA
jgi:hypothetical protein